MDLIHGASMTALEDALRFREARGAVLASNVVNADTPGYRRREMHFVEAMDQAVATLAQTHSGHLGDSSSDPTGRHRVEVGPKGTRPDGNGVNLDEEVVRVHRNTGKFTSQAGIMARIASLTRTAITGG